MLKGSLHLLACYLPSFIQTYKMPGKMLLSCLKGFVYSPIFTRYITI